MTAPWWQAPPIIEDHGGVLVVREDLVEGGSKIRFLPHIIGDAKELVYGGPFCGGAAYALSVWGKRTGAKVTLFYAKRQHHHWRQIAAYKNGAVIYEVPNGYMTVVQARAREYAADKGALLLPLGFDVPAAAEPYEAAMRAVRDQVGAIDEVWCATGSGMIARSLGRAFLETGAQVKAVVVGLASRNEAQAYTPNVETISCRYSFDQECQAPAPFPSCKNYERKAWEVMQFRGRGRRLFWNVLGDRPPA